MKEIDSRIKETLRFDLNTTDEDFLNSIRKTKSFVCKPCWEIKYCPYGPFVEEFPLLPNTLEEAKEHLAYTKNCLKTGFLGDGTPLDEAKRKMFEEEIADFNPEDYVEEIPGEVSEMACTVFGHLCPVFFVSEEFTETSEPRRRGRYIPFTTKMRVVRRDNYTCQVCGKHLLDNEVEFDHIIPLSRGGISEEHNIRLTCFNCNRDKNDLVEI